MNNPIKPLKIGKLEIKNNLVLAPMAGITDIPFRMLSKRGGAGLVCAEMVSAKAIVYRDKKTFQMLKNSKDEHPLSIQLFGSESGSMAEAAIIVEDNGADIVDINFGCPVKKVQKSGSGVKVLENEKNMVDIMEAVAKSVKVPVTIKIRIGLDKKVNMAPRIVKLAYESGIMAVAVHGRHAASGHSGTADLESVREAVEGAKIPVIGNGGIKDELSASEFFEKTKCDAIMIGRGAIGDPGIFGRILHYFKTGEVVQNVTLEDRINLVKEHLKMNVEFYGPKMGMLRMRKVFPFYVKGLPNASLLRDKFNKIENLQEASEVFERVCKLP